MLVLGTMDGTRGGVISVDLEPSVWTGDTLGHPHLVTDSSTTN